MEPWAKVECSDGGWGFAGRFQWQDHVVSLPWMRPHGDWPRSKRTSTSREAFSVFLLSLLPALWGRERYSWRHVVMCRCPRIALSIHKATNRLATLPVARSWWTFPSTSSSFSSWGEYLHLSRDLVVGPAETNRAQPNPSRELYCCCSIWLGWRASGTSIRMEESRSFLQWDAICQALWSGDTLGFSDFSSKGASGRWKTNWSCKTSCHRLLNGRRSDLGIGQPFWLTLCFCSAHGCTVCLGEQRMGSTGQHYGRIAKPSSLGLCW